MSGATGASGSNGVEGEVGALGAPGDTGVTGATGIDGEVGSVGASGSTGPTGTKGPGGRLGSEGYLIPDVSAVAAILPSSKALINVRYGGTCATKDLGCFRCISASDPLAGCASCASGFKLVVQPFRARRATLGTRAQGIVPYCVGSPLVSELENKLLRDVARLQPSVNATTATGGNPLRAIAASLNATLETSKKLVQEIVGNPLGVVN